MPIQLDAIPSVQAWLGNFDDGDKSDARLLLESLRCISANCFQMELRFALESLGITLEPPIALYAAREIEKGAKYFPDKNRRPDAVDGHKHIGSEGVVAQMVTTVNRGAPSIYLNHPPVKTLRARKCQNIVILDDIVGSGKRVSEFIQAMLRTDSVRSWWSFGWIKFHVVAYGISPMGEERIVTSLRGKRKSAGLTFQDSGRALTAGQILAPHTVSRLRRLCQKYGELHKMPWYYRTGFGDNVSTIVFSHGCPNNAPGVLWYNSATWNPLFPNRTIPEELLTLFKDETSLGQQSVVLDTLDAGGIARGRAFLSGSQDERNILLLLSAIRSKIRDTRRIALVTDLPRSAVERTIERCGTFGLIDDEVCLTDSGRDGLARAERERALAPVTMSENDFYFPTTLRGG